MVPTLGALLEHPELGLRLLTGEAGGMSEVESALLVEGADLAVRFDPAPGVLRRVLPVLSLSAESAPEEIDGAVRRLGDMGSAGVVLAPALRDVREPDLRALTASADRAGIPLLVTRIPSTQAWTRIMAVIREDRARAIDDYREMHREAMHPNGLDHLLRWLARRVAGHVVLLDRTGTPRHAFPGLPEDVLDQARGEIRLVLRGSAGAAEASLASGVVNVQPVGTPDNAGVLVVTRGRSFPPPTRSLITDASRLVGLCWRAEEDARRGRRATQADVYTREAVLHLLMTGNVQGARRVAGAIGPSLADQVRLYVIESPPKERGVLVAHCEETSEGRAWIVQCPVYRRHIIVLAPATDGADPMEEVLQDFIRPSNGISIGGSEIVALRDLASGYGQAFHALAMARGQGTGYARFSPGGDLAALLRPHAREWAEATLEPLSAYRPKRPQDPGAPELTATLRAWLDFDGGAARLLKIHRNTLVARLRHIEGLFGRSLRDMETQAGLHLALRILDGPEGDGDQLPLDALLDDPVIRQWAHLQLAPLMEHEPRPYLRTLRVWLANNARIEPAASALGISVPGARKRLTRVETLLGRSLLNGPSARYDLWFALKVHDSQAVSE
ncbi:helix-turn-helix domain-containing protein [Actinomadura sp. B10D3]|uniref:helix-turn-helix domain-containing protein n=1 Tax=Actinomadura sp. B10D3 TaxID=3153557 RepID=UPI00325E70AB